MSSSSTRCNILFSFGFCLLAQAVLLATSQNPSADNVIRVADLPVLRQGGNLRFGDLTFNLADFTAVAAASGQNVNFALDRLLEDALELPVASGDDSAQQTDVNVNAVQRNNLIAAAGNPQIPAPTQLVKAVMNSGLRR